MQTPAADVHQCAGAPGQAPSSCVLTCCRLNTCHQPKCCVHTMERSCTHIRPHPESRLLPLHVGPDQALSSVAGLQPLQLCTCTPSGPISITDLHTDMCPGQDPTNMVVNTDRSSCQHTCSWLVCAVCPDCHHYVC